MDEFALHNEFFISKKEDFPKNIKKYIFLRLEMNFIKNKEEIRKMKE
jgi:hypothetical protein